MLLPVANNRRGVDPHVCRKYRSNLACFFSSNNLAADSVHSRTGTRNCRLVWIELSNSSSDAGRPKGPEFVLLWTLSPHAAKVGPFFIEQFLSIHSSTLRGGILYTWPPVTGAGSKMPKTEVLATGLKTQARKRAATKFRAHSIHQRKR